MTSGREGDNLRAGSRGPAGVGEGEAPNPAGVSDWAEQAACLDADPELFFPSYPSCLSVTEAKEICQACPVRQQCAELALTRPEIAPFGIWGGLTEWERFPRRHRPGGRKVMDRPIMKYAETRDRMEKARRYADEGLDSVQIAEVLRVSRRTIHRYLRAS